MGPLRCSAKLADVTSSISEALLHPNGWPKTVHFQKGSSPMLIHFQKDVESVSTLRKISVLSSPQSSCSESYSVQTVKKNVALAIRANRERSRDHINLMLSPWSFSFSSAPFSSLNAWSPPWPSLRQQLLYPRSTLESCYNKPKGTAKITFVVTKIRCTESFSFSLLLDTTRPRVSDTSPQEFDFQKPSQSPFSKGVKSIWTHYMW